MPILTRVIPASTGGSSGTSLPPATQVGQVLYSTDGTTFTPQLPLTTLNDGWLVNNDGILIVVG